MIIGGLVGLAGYSQNNGSFFFPDKDDQIGLGAVLGAIVGAIVGDSIGRKSYRARVMGEQKNFDDHKVELRQYQLTNE